MDTLTIFDYQGCDLPWNTYLKYNAFNQWDLFKSLCKNTKRRTQEMMIHEIPKIPLK